MLEPFGADRTLANAITMTSGFFAANPPASLDPTGLHNLTLTGAIADPGKVMTNNMAAGVALALGSAASPSTLTLTASGTIQSQSTAAGTGVTVINDLISGAFGWTFKQGGTVYINNPNNSYTGATSVIGAGSLASGATLSGTGAVGAVGGAGTVTISSLTGTSQGGIISPGPGTGPGTILVPSMTWDPLGRYVFQYNGTNNATGGGVNSLISGTGTLSLANLSPGVSAFDINLVPAPSSGASATPVSYVIATFAGGISLSGDVTSDFTFSGSFDSATTPTVTSDGTNLILTFTPVPEPGGLALLGMAAAFALQRRGRRGKGIDRG
jgi:hypothetical protein